ncbi:MAG: RNA polymerase sigma factor [Pirellula sp.]|nr:RNA polymerase sigma factor [Pirellula sp.]
MTADEQEAIFQRWIANHLGLMIKVVRSFAPVMTDQDDLLQDVLINLWSSIANFHGNSKETTWIYRVSLQTALVWKRGERRRNKQLLNYMNHIEKNTTLFDDAPTRDEDVVEQLYAAIRQLPKLEASIALMHLDGLSYRDIADVLGITENLVGVKLTRIRKELSKRFNGSN